MARAAGVSQAAPYHHFADKEALLAAIAAEGFRALSRAMREAAGAATPQDHLEGLGAGYVRFAHANPELFRLMQGPYFRLAGRDDALAAAAGEGYGLLEAGVRACMPGRDDAEIDLACKAAWALVHGAAMLIVDRRIDVGGDDAAVEHFARAIARKLVVGAI